MDKGIFTEIVKGFEKFVAVFKKNNVMIVTYIFILFMLFYNIVLQPINFNNIIEKVLERERTERQFIEDKDFENRIKVERTLIPILDNIVETDTLITRAFIAELHNGIKSRGRMDLLFFSITFDAVESNRQDMETISEYFQRQSINSMFPTGLQSIAYKKFVYWDETSSNRLYKKLTHFGVNYAMCIPIKDKNNIPLVLLVLCSEKPFNAKDKYSYLEHTITAIGDMLIVNS